MVKLDVAPGLVGGIPCTRAKIPCIFPAPAKNIPCSAENTRAPAQGIFAQRSRILDLLEPLFAEKREIPCVFPAKQGIRRLVTHARETSRSRSAPWSRLAGKREDPCSGRTRPRRPRRRESRGCGRWA